MSIGKFARSPGCRSAPSATTPNAICCGPRSSTTRPATATTASTRSRRRSSIATLRDLDVPHCRDRRRWWPAPRSDRDRALAAHLARTEASRMATATARAPAARPHARPTTTCITEREKIMPSVDARPRPGRRTPARRHAVQPRLGPARSTGPHGRGRRRDDARGAREPLPLGQRRHHDEPRPGRVAVLAGVRRARAVRAGAPPREPVPGARVDERSVSPFDVGIAHEALARAYRVAGDAAAVARARGARATPSRPKSTIPRTARSSTTTLARRMIHGTVRQSRLRFDFVAASVEQFRRSWLGTRLSTGASRRFTDTGGLRQGWACPVLRTAPEFWSSKSSEAATLSGAGS